jgi:hypothetical protein
MGATSDDLMDLARAGAERIDMPDNRVRYPSFTDVEEQCVAEYDELLSVCTMTTLVPADVQRQDRSSSAWEIVANDHPIEELIDNLAPDLAQPSIAPTGGRAEARRGTKALTVASPVRDEGTGLRAEGVACRS